MSPASLSPPGPPGPRGHRWGRTAGALALVAALATAGCAPSSPLGDPTGVDELVIPTPSPQSDDFVAEVDNPWLPLPPGGRWRYRVTSPEGDGTRRVRVLPERVTVDGVPTTAVRSVLRRGGRVVSRRTDYLAQDTRGNVWWFGSTAGLDGKAWRAGEDGAQAGLAMAAGPRVGDGYRPAQVPGRGDWVTTVVATGDQVVLETVVDGRVGSGITSTFRTGTGLLDRLDAADSEKDGLVEAVLPGVDR